MNEFQRDPKKLGVCAEETLLPIVPPSSKLLKRQTKRDHHTMLVSMDDLLKGYRCGYHAESRTLTD
jgi:hypothetical protein